MLKILIPNYSAGSVIGKGGQTINQLQQASGARIKLSQNRCAHDGESCLGAISTWLPDAQSLVS